jgi:5'(3')-deoxyribonucleotidase
MAYLLLKSHDRIAMCMDLKHYVHPIEIQAFDFTSKNSNFRLMYVRSRIKLTTSNSLVNMYNIYLTILNLNFNSLRTSLPRKH